MMMTFMQQMTSNNTLIPPFVAQPYVPHDSSYSYPPNNSFPFSEPSYDTEENQLLQLLRCTLQQLFTHRFLFAQIQVKYNCCDMYYGTFKRQKNVLQLHHKCLFHQQHRIQCISGQVRTGVPASKGVGCVHSSRQWSSHFSQVLCSVMQAATTLVTFLSLKSVF